MLRSLLRTAGFLAFVAVVIVVTLLVVFRERPSESAAAAVQATASLPYGIPGDVNCDNALDIADPVFLLGYLFGSGPAPAACTPQAGGVTFAGVNSHGYEEYTLDQDPTVVLILIPGGTFLMGSMTGELLEQPVHEVTLSPYFLSKYEITNAQYRMYCDQTVTPYPPDPGFSGIPNYFSDPLYDSHPVVMVSWLEIQGYLAWAGLVLPTEAQWEYAARWTDDRTYPWGTDAPDLGGVYRANYYPAPSPFDADGWDTTSPVGGFATYVGPFGTFGQAGNAWEWCQDWHWLYPAGPVTDPTGPASASARVMRGGGWNSLASLLRCAFRAGSAPSTRANIVGFRPGRVIP